MLKLNDVTKIYQTASKEKVTALSNVSLSIDKSGIVFIVGQSGSGKTTLLNLIGGLDMPEQGEILVEEHVLGGDIPLEKYRQNYVGFVFQEYNLLENLSVYENIAIAVSSCTKRELNEKIVKVLKEVDLSGYENRKMNELSGGQKQRVAIARALAKNTSILLCDEPTGNLDSHTSKEIFDLLKKISLEKTIIVVSHNEELAKEYADRLIRIADGKIISDQQYVSEITVNDSSNKTVNNVPFRHKLKLGFKNLFTQKFSIQNIHLTLWQVFMCRPLSDLKGNLPNFKPFIDRQADLYISYYEIAIRQIDIHIGQFGNLIDEKVCNDLFLVKEQLIKFISDIKNPIESDCFLSLDGPKDWLRNHCTTKWLKDQWLIY